MPAFTLVDVGDEVLLARLVELVDKDRQTTAVLLAHLAEVEARGLFLPAACSSMFMYCTRVLRMSEDEALKRIRAARFARRFPLLFDAVADGRLNLTGVVLLGPHLTETNVDAVIADASHRRKAEIEELVARLAPRPDLPAGITPIASPVGQTEATQVVPEPPAPPPAAPPTRVTPLSPARFALRATISQETRDKLERAQALLRHRIPDGDLGEVIGRAVDALLVVLEREIFGVTSRARKAKTRDDDSNPRYVSRAVRRAVYARDAGQCTFVSASGVRCTERGFLQFDHRTPVAHGGKPTADEMHLLCFGHNQYEAERLLGADLVREKREQARAARKGAPRSSHADLLARRSSPAVERTSDDVSGPNNDARAPARTDDVARPRTGDAAGPRTDDAAGPGSDAAVRSSAEAAGAFDGDVTLALRGMGFAAGETRRAMTDTAQVPATTFEARLRVALAALTRGRGFRCSDGPLDLAVHRLHTLLSCA